MSLLKKAVVVIALLTSDC
jgi:hypothetical protein